MRHINLKNYKEPIKISDFKIIPTWLFKGSVAIKFKNGQYLDHDFVLRATDSDYSGVWSSQKEAKAFIKKEVYKCSHK